MHRCLLSAALSMALVAFAASQEPALIAPSEALTPEQEKSKFHLPPGWEAQLVAAEPDIAKPMNIAFDAQGRLWVTDSVEYPFAAKEGQGRDTVKVLSDFGPDGRARKITTFADKLNIPIGILPLKGRTLVYSIPTIWEMKDTDGDGKADTREPFLTGFGHRDTHGMTNSFTYGLDGWIYACHGFANDSTIKGRDGSTIKLNSGNTYRFRPDGTHVEQFTWGQVNPFGLTFDKWGNLFSADCHSKPITLLLRGGCYESFGKPHDGLGFVPDICHDDHGGTGLAGIVCLETDTVPPAFRGNFLVGNVVMSKINRDSMVWDGDIKQTKLEPDFLRSDDAWFRPVDFKLGPDGAIYVADFYNCIIGHYEVDLKHPRRDRTRGRIWRFVYKGPTFPASQSASPVGPINKDWTKCTTAELIEALGNPNLALRTVATHVLVEREGDETTRECKIALQSARTEKQAHLLWVLARRNALSEAAIDSAMSEAGVFRELSIAKVHAMRQLTESQTFSMENRRKPIYRGMGAPEPMLRRLAWEAAAAQWEGISPYLVAQAVAAHSQDSLTRHAGKIALRDLLSKVDAFPNNPSGLQEIFAQVALGMKEPHSANAAAFLEYALADGKLPSTLTLDACRYVGRFSKEPAVSRFIKSLANSSQQLEHLKAVRQGCLARGATLPPKAMVWASERGNEMLTGGKEHELQFACRWVDELQLKELSPKLIAIGESQGQSSPNRLAAAIALAHLREAKAVGILNSLWTLTELSADQRQVMIDALAGIPSPEARKELAEILIASPDELQRRIALGLASSKDGVELLLKTIEEGKASPRLLEDQPLAQKVKAAGVRGLEPRLARLMQGLVPADAKIRTLIAQRTAEFGKAKPDIAKGKLLFEKHCIACHQLGGQGAKIGPQLDGIGLRGADRLIEDIIDPSRNVDQAFRATLLSLDDGKLVTGLLLREEGETLVLADEKGKELRVPKSKVEQRKQLPTSPMPANLAEQISAEEFPHLLGYLLSQRAKQP